MQKFPSRTAAHPALALDSPPVADRCNQTLLPNRHSQPKIQTYHTLLTNRHSQPMRYIHRQSQIGMGRHTHRRTGRDTAQPRHTYTICSPSRVSSPTGADLIGGGSSHHEVYHCHRHPAASRTLNLSHPPLLLLRMALTRTTAPTDVSQLAGHCLLLAVCHCAHCRHYSWCCFVPLTVARAPESSRQRLAHPPPAPGVLCPTERYGTCAAAPHPQILQSGVGSVAAAVGRR